MGLLVSQGEQEIGIRMALGANARDVVRLLAGEGMKPVCAGIVFGVVSAALLERFLASLLFFM
jgi:ABC-type lipoprotein release transport system permease subunit